MYWHFPPMGGQYWIQIESRVCSVWHRGEGKSRWFPPKRARSEQQSRTSLLYGSVQFALYREASSGSRVMRPQCGACFSNSSEHVYSFLVQPTNVHKHLLMPGTKRRWAHILKDPVSNRSTLSWYSWVNGPHVCWPSSVSWIPGMTAAKCWEECPDRPGRASQWDKSKNEWLSPGYHPP